MIVINKVKKGESYDISKMLSYGDFVINLKHSIIGNSNVRYPFKIFIRSYGHFFKHTTYVERLVGCKKFLDNVKEKMTAAFIGAIKFNIYRMMYHIELFRYSKTSKAYPTIKEFNIHKNKRPKLEIHRFYEIKKDPSKHHLYFIRQMDDKYDYHFYDIEDYEDQIPLTMYNIKLKHLYVKKLIGYDIPIFIKADKIGQWNVRKFYKNKTILEAREKLNK